MHKAPRRASRAAATADSAATAPGAEPTATPAPAPRRRYSRVAIILLLLALLLVAAAAHGQVPSASPPAANRPSPAAPAAAGPPAARPGESAPGSPALRSDAPAPSAPNTAAASRPEGTRSTPAALGESAAPARTISIVVQDLVETGGLTPADVASTNEYLRGQIAGLPNYRVVEQSRLRDLLEVNELQQLSGLYELEGAPEQLQLVGADQVIVGSVGRLLERVVVSVRLVELVTGEILFSYTAHASDEDLFLRLDEVVQRIREYGLLYIQNITVADIADLARRRRYAEAQERLEAYLRQQRRRNQPVADTPEFRELQQTINANLYEDYLRSARRARRRNDFVDARRAITRAIALRPAAEALEERDRIQLAEEAYRQEIERQERLIEMRAEERSRQEAAGVYLSPLDAVGLFFTSINTTPNRISVVATERVNSALAVPTAARYLGLGYSRTANLFSAGERERLVWIQSVARISMNITYQSADRARALAAADSSDPTPVNALTVHAALAPHTGFTVQVLSLLISAGLDGGIRADYGSDGTAQWHLSPTVGLWAIADLMVLRSLGIHLGARLDYLVDPPPTGAAIAPSPFVLTVTSGVSL
jgi:hypothetical protein